YFFGMTDLQTTSSLGIAVGAAFGIGGNNLYYQKAKRAIEKSKRNDPSTYKRDLEKKGGASAAHTFVGIALMLAYGIISIFVLEPLIVGTPDVAFGHDSANGEVIDTTNQFEPSEEMHIEFYFDDGKGGPFEVVIEKEEGDSSLVYENWEDEVPEDWSGVVSILEAPVDEGTYTLKIFKNN